MARSRTDALTPADFAALRIPDGPEARAWMDMMNRFIDWRKQCVKVVDARGVRHGGAFNVHFFRWWFGTLNWRGKILDIGCGGGEKNGLLTAKLVYEYRGVDPLLLEETTTGKWQFHRGIGEAMPFIPTGWANIVVALSVMQHCINPDQLAREAVRCLSRDPANRGAARFYGTVCVRATPERSPLVSVDFRDGAHVAEILTGAGLRVVRQQTFDGGLYCFEAALA